MPWAEDEMRSYVLRNLLQRWCQPASAAASHVEEIAHAVPEAVPVEKRSPSVVTGDFCSFSPEDHAALASLVSKVAKPGCRICEVGSWLGNGSTRAILQTLVDIPNTRLTCVDTWQGSPGVRDHELLTREYDAIATFRHNVRYYRKRVDMLVADSVTAANMLADAHFDLVFLDADHRYHAIAADIKAWRRKVKRGGILCGHDCETRPTPELQSQLEAGRERDTIVIEKHKFAEIHAGCVLAVDEAFGNSVRLFSDESVSTVWAVEISPWLRRARSPER